MLLRWGPIFYALDGGRYSILSIMYSELITLHRRTCPVALETYSLYLYFMLYTYTLYVMLYTLYLPARPRDGGQVVIYRVHVDRSRAAWRIAYSV